MVRVRTIKHTRGVKNMKHNEFKDRLYEILNENDVALRIADIDTDDFANTFTVKTGDGSIFEIETRKIE